MASPSTKKIVRWRWSAMKNNQLVIVFFVKLCDFSVNSVLNNYVNSLTGNREHDVYSFSTDVFSLREILSRCHSFSIDIYALTGNLSKGININRTNSKQRF